MEITLYFTHYISVYITGVSFVGKLRLISRESFICEAMSSHALLLWLGVLCLLCQGCAGELLLREDLREITTGAASPMDPGALELIRHGAQHNEPESIYLYAMLKFYGHGVQQNTQEAIELLQQAADLSHRDAEFALGVLYGRGDKGQFSLAFNCVVFCSGHVHRHLIHRPAQERPHERGVARLQCQSRPRGRQMDAGHVCLRSTAASLIESADVDLLVCTTKAAA